MKRLLKNLDVLSEDLCIKLLLPLVRTYIYNPDYDQQTIVVTSAIDCIGGLASKLCWKNYAKLLQQFLSQKPLEPRYQKQRVKVLASVLDGFHFDDSASMIKAKGLLQKLLKRKSTTGYSFFKDGTEETQTGKHFFLNESTVGPKWGATLMRVP